MNRANCQHLDQIFVLNLPLPHTLAQDIITSQQDYFKCLLTGFLLWSFTFYRLCLTHTPDIAVSSRLCLSQNTSVVSYFTQNKTRNVSNQNLEGILCFDPTCTHTSLVSTSFLFPPSIRSIYHGLFAVSQTSRAWSHPGMLIIVVSSAQNAVLRDVHVACWHYLFQGFFCVCVLFLNISLSQCSLLWQPF